MKEHIDEMAKVLIDYTNKNHIMASHVILEDYAEALYNAGYRKQKESVWSTSVMFDVPAQKITGYTHICQSCFYLYKDKNQYGNKFCPNCGAKMKGGSE